MGRFGHMEGCKCMTCAGDRYQAAETLARRSEPDKFFAIQRKIDNKQNEIDILQQALREDKVNLTNLVMSYYNEANYEQS